MTNAFDAAVSGSIILQAMRYGRHSKIKRDPRDCPACGKPWATVALAMECCEPMGVAIAFALDAAELREHGGWATEGSTAIMESALRTPGHPRREACLAAFGRGMPAGSDPMRRFAIDWQREIAGEADRMLLDAAEKRHRDKLRWMREWRQWRREEGGAQR